MPFDTGTTIGARPERFVLTRDPRPTGKLPRGAFEQTIVRALDNSPVFPVLIVYVHRARSPEYLPAGGARVQGSSLQCVLRRRSVAGNGTDPEEAQQMMHFVLDDLEHLVMP